MAKQEERAARRYAKALFELCDPASLDQVKDALNGFRDVWNKNAEFQGALRNPANPLLDRERALRQVAQLLLKDNVNFANFLSLLLHNKRLSVIGAVVDAFSQMIDQLKKRLALEITTARSVDDQEKGAVQNRVQQDFGGLASIVWQVDPELLGGLRIKAGDKLYDGSVSGSLETLRDTLIN